MFDNLKNILASDHEKKAKQEEIWRKKAEECTRNAQPFEKMVKDVLEELRSVYYPDSRVHSHLTGNKGHYEYEWKIYHSGWASNKGGGYSVDVSDVLVALIFKRNNVPKHFMCIVRSGGRAFGTNTKLSQEALVKALSELYLKKERYERSWHER